jgi:tetratricopeptide (TPR) repeat protein
LPAYPRLLSCLSLLLILTACSGTLSQRDTDRSAASPASMPPSYDRALALMRRGSHAEAIPILRQVSEESSGNADVYLNLGIACRVERLDEDALTALNNSIELNSKNPAAYHQKGIVLRQTGDFEGALEAYTKALSLAPDYALAHRTIGILYDLYLRQPAVALEHYRTYQRLTGASPDSEVSAWIVDLERRSANEHARATP